MSLTRFAIKYPPVTWVITVFILVVGLMALFTLPRREDPDLQGRFVQITGIYPGASAGQVEQLLTDKVERGLLELDDIKTLNSTSRPGAFVAFAEAADRVHDLKKFHDDIRHRITDLQPSLPAEVARVAVDDRFADTSAVILAVSDDSATDREREQMARRLRDRLRALTDVADANLLGVRDEQISVNLSPQRLSHLGVSPAQVAAALKQANVLATAAGTGDFGNLKLALQPGGSLDGAASVAGLPITMPDGTTLHIRDVADVDDTRRFCWTPWLQFHLQDTKINKYKINIAVHRPMP